MGQHMNFSNHKHHNCDWSPGMLSLYVMFGRILENNRAHLTQNRLLVSRYHKSDSYSLYIYYVAVPDKMSYAVLDRNE